MDTKDVLICGLLGINPIVTCDECNEDVIYSESKADITKTDTYYYHMDCYKGELGYWNGKTHREMKQK